MSFRVKLATVFIFFIVLIFFYNSAYSSVNDHKEDIKTLNSYMKEAEEQIPGFKPLIKDAEKRVKHLEKILNKFKGEMPDRESENYGYHFSYYGGNIVIYESEKGIGIKINDNEKMFKKQKQLSYTLRDKYSYKTFESMEGAVSKHIAIPQFIYKQKDKQFSLKKYSDRKEQYYYFAKTNGDDITYEKITLPNQSYIKKVENNKIISQYYFKDKTSIQIIPNFLISYFINKKLFYTCFINGNISLSPDLSQIVFDNYGSVQSQFYIKSIGEDFPHSIYVYFLKELIKRKIRLSESQRVYQSLINIIRSHYNLTPIKPHRKLNKSCKLHGKYILKYHPKNLHIQYYKDKGYFGTTPFQRRKKLKYPFRVNEWIAFSNDPIKNFVKALEKEEWIYAFLNPNALHIGYYRIHCQKEKHQGIMDLILLSHRHKDSAKNPVLIFPKGKEIHFSKYFLKSKITQKGSFCEPPKVEFELGNRFLFTILNYNKRVKVKKIVGRLGNQVVKLKQKKVNDNINVIYLLKPLRASITYNLLISYKTRGKRAIEISSTIRFKNNYFLSKPKLREEQ